MPASSPFEIVYISADFTPFQIQSQSLALWGMEGFARWTREKVGGWQQRMLQEDKLGVVVAGVEIEYHQPHQFGDSAELQAYPRFYCNERGSVIYNDCEFRAGDKKVARYHMVVIPVKLADEESMVASRGCLEGDLLEKFKADADELPHLQAYEARERLKVRFQKTVDEGTHLGEHSHSFTLYRHRCEVADQWLYTEVPAIISEGREDLALSSGANSQKLRVGVSRPLKRVVYELYRPFYVFERGRLETLALEHQGDTVFAHQIKSPDSDQVHGCALEYF